VGHEVGNGAPKLALTERYNAIEALLLDRSYEALRVGVTVWRAERGLHDPHFFPLEELPHGITSLPIAITDQHATASQDTVDVVSQVTDGPRK
jgi:hypothetical protein